MFMYDHIWAISELSKDNIFYHQIFMYDYIWAIPELPWIIFLYTAFVVLLFSAVVGRFSSVKVNNPASDTNGCEFDSRMRYFFS